jgi:hypothetical protein
MRLSTILLVTAAAATLPAAAHGGTFTYYACKLADGWPVTASGFASSTPTDETFLENDCDGDHGLVAALAKDAPAGTSASWTYSAPPGMPVVSVRLSRQVSGPSPQASIAYDFVGTSDNCQVGQYCEAGVVERSWSGEPRSTLEFRISCPMSACDSGVTGTDWWFAGSDREYHGVLLIKSIAITLLDSEPPRFEGEPSGSLFDADRTHSGVVSARFAASDVGSGLGGARLLVDGREAPEASVTGLASCEPPFSTSTPCPSDGAADVRLDTTHMPDGPHTVVLELWDATGENRVSYGPVQIRTTNFGPDSQLASSSDGLTVASAAMIVGTGRWKRPSRLQQSAKTATATGQLVSRNGKPIGGATLQVFAKADVPGALPKLVSTPTTDATGNFSFLIPKGPSRRFTVRYLPSADADVAATWRFRVVVPAPIGLLANRARFRNGQTLVLTAHLAGADVPRGSAVAAFQVRIGNRWHTFAKRDISKNGIARVRHRFRVTFQRMTYRFRAITLRNARFPFADGRSGVLAVRVN